MKKLMLFLLAIVVAAGVVNARELKPRIVFEKYLFAEGVDPNARDLTQLMVKFFDEDMIRLRNGELTSITGKNVLQYTHDFLARHPEISVEVIITSQTEEEYAAMIRRNEDMSGWDLVDLFSFYNFRLTAAAADPKALLADILNAPEVETAYYEPIAIPALCTDLGSTTPDYRAQQTYHDPAPLGVNLDYANSQFGLETCDGVTSTVTAVIETGGSLPAQFEVNHEDFTSVVNATGSAFDTTRYHGTAVAGIVGACDENLVGVVGFTADHGLRWYDINALASHADVYNLANAQLDPGEYATNSWGYFSNPMPPGQSCPCNPGQNGMVPPEYSASVKAAIQNGVAGGIFYFISAGNGCTNLDHSTYGTTFRWSTDTGSMYVGAVDPDATHNASCYTNYGERVTLNSWGDGIVTTGYGSLRTGMGRREYYANSFGGTSGAGPIVAGCAGVMNNVYRSINSGANIAPTTMRSWLDNNGTAPGTTPGNIGLQPNLFGIMAPELNPDIRTGWYSYVVPRNTGDATGASADLPANLNSSPSNTYWNSAIENESYFATADPAYWRLYRDDVYIIWAGGGTLGPLGRTYHTNTQGTSANVRGGRHTTRITCDPLEELAEQNENNNSYTRQFVWDPYNLTSGTAQTFSRPPTRLVTDQPGSYYNCDGYKGQTNFGGWWDILACMASTSTADYDARVYSEAITSTNGFDDYEAWSGAIGPVDFVGVNENVLGFGTQLFGSVINWDDENASYIVEAQTSINVGTPGVGRNLEATGSIGTNEIFENYEFYVSPSGSDSTVMYTIEVEIISGNADVAISVFGPDDGYFSASNRNFFRNSTGNGGNEILHFVPGRSRWFGVVVHKYDNNSWNESANFNLYIGKSLPDLTHTLRSGWSHKVVVTQAVSSEPITLPATLTGNVNTNRLFGGYINQGGVATVAGINDRFYIDGPGVFTTGSWASWPAGSSTWWGNQGPVFVFGGRHNVGDSIDVFLEMAEWLEDNNRHDEQFVWTPWPLSNQSPVLTAQPGPNWRNSQSSVLFSAWNQDGYRFTGSNRWSGVAMAPTDPDDYYVMGLYDPSTGSENGFVTRHVPSFHGTGLIGFVLENGSVNGAASYDVGVTNNWAWPGVVSEGAYRVYQCNSIQDLVNNAVNGPFTLTSNHLMHVFDMQMTSGVPVRFILDNLGANDLGLAIFDANDVYGSRSQNGTVTNAAGDGGDETINFTPTSTGRHGIVVFKHDNTDLGSNQYRLIVGQRTPAVPQRLVLQTINSAVNPIQMRAHWDSVTVDISGAPLNVDHYQLFYTLTMNNPPFPGGWTPYLTTPLATLNFTVANTVEYFMMVVIAVDNDGYIIGHSPLPDGSSVTGMRIDAISTMGQPEGATWSVGDDPPVMAPANFRE